MKKRVFAVILGSVMAVSLMACGTKENETKDGTKTYTCLLYTSPSPRDS